LIKKEEKRPFRPEKRPKMAGGGVGKGGARERGGGHWRIPNSWGDGNPSPSGSSQTQGKFGAACKRNPGNYEQARGALKKKEEKKSPKRLGVH